MGSHEVFTVLLLSVINDCGGNYMYMYTNDNFILHDCVQYIHV